MDAPKRLQGLPSWRLSAAALVGDRLVNEALATEGVRKYHFRVLVALSDDGPLSQAGSAAGSRSTAATWPPSRRSSSNASCWPARATTATAAATSSPSPPRGKAALARMDKAIAAAQTTLLAPLSSAEQRQLSELLGRLIELVGLAGAAEHVHHEERELQRLLRVQPRVARGS